MPALGFTSTIDGRKKLKQYATNTFPQTLKELETYLGMTGALRHFIEGYSWKAEPLQERILKDSPIAGSRRRNFANSTVYQKPSDTEIKAFNDIQNEFSSPKFLHHHNPTKQLYVDIDSSKERGHGVIAYHVTDNHVHSDLTKPPSRTAVCTTCIIPQSDVNNCQETLLANRT